MNRRQGFTLMELLLVVAVLAIVAAAAAPTFFSGASEAMDEARKASFLSAYQSTISGANMSISMQAARGTASGEIKLDEEELNKYAPKAARTFTNAKGVECYLSAVLKTTGEGNTTSSPEVVIEGYNGKTKIGQTVDPSHESKNTTEQLNDLWDALNGITTPNE